MALAGSGEKAAASAGQPSWYSQRNSTWTKEGCDELRRSVSEHEPPMPDIEYKIVLFGAVQAGKSSFINTLGYAMHEKYVQMANSAPAERTVTTEFRQHRIKLERKHIFVCDTQGYELTAEEDQCSGPSEVEIEKILDGEIVDRHRFGEDMEEYHPLPPPKSKVNLVAIVWDAAYIFQKALIKQLQSVLEAAKQRDIACCVLVTKVDKCSEVVDKNLDQVFTDDKIQEVIETVSQYLEIESSSISPMQNYTGIHNDNDTAIKYLALLTLDRLLDMADTTLGRQITSLRPTPWKNVVLKERTEAIETLSALVSDVTKGSGITNINIAVVGLHGSGKSEFINAVLSVLHGKSKHDAYAGTSQGPPITDTLKVYKAPSHLALHLYDTMGLIVPQKPKATKPQIQTLQAVCAGRIPEGANFEDLQDAVDESNLEGTVQYIKRYLAKCRTPKLSARMHAVVLVIDGSSFSALSPEENLLLQDTYSMIRKQLDVPCVVAVSHLDKVCQHVQKSAEAMFRSDETRSCVKKIHESNLRVPDTEILPVLTLSPVLEGQGSTEARDELLLHSLHHVCDRAKDYIASQPRQRCSQPTVICMLRTFAVLVVVAAIVLALIRAH